MKTSKSKSKKILILNWRDIKNPLAGGAEQSLHEHAKYWEKRGYEVDWCASSWEGAKREEDIDGIRVRRLGSHYTVHLLVFLEYLRGRVGKYDIVIDCFHFLPFFTPLYMRKAKIIALINEPAKNAWFKNIFFPASVVGYLLEPLFFIPYRKKQFITSADSIKKELISDYKILEKNIHIVPHGVTLPEKLPGVTKEKKPTIIYCSRITKDKGIEDAIEAIAMVIKEIPDLQFWIVGKAEKEEYLEFIKKKVKEKDIEKNTTFFGFVSENKKFELLGKAWILIHPSVREGWGLNVIEANAMKTPAVGYNISGLRDSIRNNQTGILVDNNHEKLSESVAHLVKNKSELKRISDTAKKWSEKFSWEKSASQSEKLLQ